MLCCAVDASTYLKICSPDEKQAMARQLLLESDLSLARQLSVQPDKGMTYLHCLLGSDLN